MSREAYHSALHPPGSATPTDRWEGHGSLAYVMPSPARLPSAFDWCDVLYSDPPWEAGYDEFNRRAGYASAPSYADWMRQFDGMVHHQRKPAAIVLGKKGLRLLTPEHAQPVTLNGAPAMVATYGLPRDALDGCRTSEDILKRLAGKFFRVGDPCCGYGRAGRIFAAAGNRFVMSDVNPECIGYIAANADGWFA